MTIGRFITSGRQGTQAPSTAPPPPAEKIHCSMETSASGSMKTFFGYLRNPDESVESRSTKLFGAYLVLWWKLHCFVRNENDDEKVRQAGWGSVRADQPRIPVTRCDWRSASAKRGSRGPTSPTSPLVLVFPIFIFFGKAHPSRGPAPKFRRG